MCVCKIYTNRFIDNARGCAEHSVLLVSSEQIDRSRSSQGPRSSLRTSWCCRWSESERCGWGVCLNQVFQPPQINGSNWFQETNEAWATSESKWMWAQCIQSPEAAAYLTIILLTPHRSRVLGAQRHLRTPQVNMCGEYPGIQHWMGKFKSTCYGRLLGRLA